MVIVNITVALVSVSPGLAVPPLSWSLTETVAVPLAFAAGVNDRTPVGEIAGCTENRAVPLLLTRNATVWLGSPGPGEIAVAQTSLYAAESSLTVTSGPAVNDGASLTPVIVKRATAVAVFASAAPFVVPLSDTV
jgi:hypothetical protein